MLEAVMQGKGVENGNTNMLLVIGSLCHLNTSIMLSYIHWTNDTASIVSRVQRSTQLTISHFGDETFQTVSCTGTNSNLVPNNIKNIPTLI